MTQFEANATTAGTSPVLSGRRRAVSAAALVQEHAYAEAMDIPRVFEPAAGRVDLVGWAGENRNRIEAALCQHGALLFRGFGVGDVEVFRRFVAATSDGLVNYTYRASPRAEVSERVYTSTEYPSDQRIFPHNEHAFSPVFPRKLYFYCDTPPTTGGETPIGSGRLIRDAIPDDVRERFLSKGVMYIRNYAPHMGLPWQTVFQCEDRDGVETYCRRHDIRWRWKADGGLYTEQVAPAFVRHPVTGEALWFNHATFFHVTTLNPSIRTALLSSYAESDLPNHTYYGDGTPIEPEVLELLRAAYERSMVEFPWRQGDLLMLDNMLVVHARRPFTGPRRILVGMADPVEAASVRLDVAR